MQLVAYGAQDVYLTGNPQITFWKVTYRRLLFSFRGGVAFDSVRQDGRDTLSAPVRPQTRLDADSVS